MMGVSRTLEVVCSLRLPESEDDRVENTLFGRLEAEGEIGAGCPLTFPEQRQRAKRLWLLKDLLPPIADGGLLAGARNY